MVYRITHTTEYRYSSEVSGCQNIAHLLPASSRRQRCLDSDLDIQPRPRSMRHFRDYFGNTTTYFELAEPHRMLRVTVFSRVEVLATSVGTDMRPWEEAVVALMTAGDEESVLAREFLLPSPYFSQADQEAGLLLEDELRSYASPSFIPGRGMSAALQDLMHRIHADFGYRPGTTTVATPLMEVMARREGVCQDFAHVMIACLRSVGIPACYISGYLETAPPPGQPRWVGADATHAWVGAYSSGVGWMEFDPTNDLIPEMQHVRLARGRDYGDVAPLKGVVFGGGEHQLSVSVDVCPLPDKKT